MAGALTKRPEHEERLSQCPNKLHYLDCPMHQSSHREAARSEHYPQRTSESVMGAQKVELAYEEVAFLADLYTSETSAKRTKACEYHHGADDDQQLSQTSSWSIVTRSNPPKSKSSSSSSPQSSNRAKIHKQQIRRDSSPHCGSAPFMFKIFAQLDSTQEPINETATAASIKLVQHSSFRGSSKLSATLSAPQRASGVPVERTDDLMTASKAAVNTTIVTGRAEQKYALMGLSSQFDHLPSFSRYDDFPLVIEGRA